MNKIYFALLVISILIISCKSQLLKQEIKPDINYIPYFLKVYEADSLYLTNNYKRSYEILDSLFKKFKPLNLEKYKEYETYISSAFMLDKKINFKDSILKSIQNYGSNPRYFKYDSILNLAYLHSKISKKESLESNEIYLSKLNFSLRDTIKKMCAIDQDVRNKYTSYNNEIKNIDSINQIKLKSIFIKYGYPEEKLIGEYYVDSTNVNLGAILLHTNKDFRLNFLLPKILESVKMGKAYPQMYTESMDRYLYDYQNKKELYGSYTGKKKNLLYPKKIDSIRKSVGLPSITYNNWRMKTKFGIEPNN